MEKVSVSLAHEKAAELRVERDRTLLGSVASVSLVLANSFIGRQLSAVGR